VCNALICVALFAQTEEGRTEKKFPCALVIFNRIVVIITSLLAEYKTAGYTYFLGSGINGNSSEIAAFSILSM
jgi:hypothetical protein